MKKRRRKKSAPIAIPNPPADEEAMFVKVPISPELVRLVREAVDLVPKIEAELQKFLAARRR